MRRENPLKQEGTPPQTRGDTPQTPPSKRGLRGYHPL